MALIRPRLNLKQQRQQLGPDVSEAEFFEVFAAEQALNEYDLSYEEMRSGSWTVAAIVASTGSMSSRNGELVHEDSDLSQLNKGVQLDLVVVQATISAGFSESRLDRLTAATETFSISRNHLASSRPCTKRRYCVRRESVLADLDDDPMMRRLEEEF